MEMSAPYYSTAIDICKLRFLQGETNRTHLPHGPQSWLAWLGDVSPVRLVIEWIDAVSVPAWKILYAGGGERTVRGDQAGKA